MKKQPFVQWFLKKNNTKTEYYVTGTGETLKYPVLQGNVPHLSKNYTRI